MDQEQARATFDYCDGRLLWKVKLSNKTTIGKAAGYTRKDRYVVVNRKGCISYVHRLVWVWHHGEIPGGMVVDHIDRDPSNNRIENLRLLRHAQNIANQKLRTDSSSGEQGIYPLGPQYKKAYRAQFRGKHLGCFSTIDEARAAREHASQAFIGAS